MFYTMDNGRLQQAEHGQWSAQDERLLVGVCTPAEFEPLRERFLVSTRALQQSRDGKTAWFENGDGADYMSLTPNHASGGEPASRALVVLRRNLLLFVCEDTEAVLALLQPLPEGRALNSGRLLFILIERMTAGDGARLETIEAEITELEDALLVGKRDCVREIISLRKRLMAFKRYYDELLDLLDDLLENENALLEPAVLQQFRIHDGRVERLSQRVLHLRDYVTQVRESYQAEVDISLNNIMKLFTVITALFLPLTLVVGWYGMNLAMPELRWPGTYPLVIIACLAIVVFGVAYFKRHKWF